MILLIFSLGIQSCYAANDFKLSSSDYKSAAIVCEKDQAVASYAASELQKHLKLITGFNFPIVNTKENYNKFFFVGIKPSEDTKPLEADEARYLITSNAVYLYGEDSFSNSATVDEILNASIGRAGTLYAVYDFLEYELGVKWIEPGDDGIIYESRKDLYFPEKSHSWISPFLYRRGMRNSGKIPETYIWLKRMRLGNRDGALAFGHAFTTWWAKYGQSHPEYFALNGQGERRPLKLAERVKMCVSNPKLVQQIVDDWLANRAAGLAGDYINACENDSAGLGLAEFCHCENCIALDNLPPGEKFGQNKSEPRYQLTDRYVAFWNNIVTLARKTVPNAVVCGYAYENFLLPPRATKVADGVLLNFVPCFNDDWSRTQGIYDGWKKMGVKELLYRPNDLNSEIGLPMGTGKRILEAQKMAVDYGAKGVDHDSVFNLWTGISGSNYYMIAKSIYDPSKSYDELLNDYCLAFGPAKEDIKAYLEYWRVEVMDKRIQPANQAGIAESGVGILYFGNVKKMGKDIGKYYNQNDFDITDGYLNSAQQKKLNPSQKRMVERMIIANRNSRLGFEALLAQAQNDSAKSAQASKALQDFRTAHKDDLNVSWTNVIAK